MVRMKSVLLLLNLMFDNQSEPPFNHLGINFPAEIEQCDTLVTWAYPLGPHFKNRNHHPSLLLPWYCPVSPRKAEEVCEPREPYNVKNLHHLVANVIHTWCPAAEELLDYLSNLS